VQTVSEVAFVWEKVDLIVFKFLMDDFVRGRGRHVFVIVHREVPAAGNYDGIPAKARQVFGPGINSETPRKCGGWKEI